MKLSIKWKLFRLERMAKQIDRKYGIKLITKHKERLRRYIILYRHMHDNVVGIMAINNKALEIIKEKYNLKAIYAFSCSKDGEITPDGVKNNE